ncbi:hypothetical protein BKA70DRAFT_1251421 [Coprinopsis sp. MPI-PUGE-AT-0042]|nr:hypothetical protein BKA70DRAFT_1251421 [Coprinopsis sp. MPI-PUGE-AT-0042]
MWCTRWFLPLLLLPLPTAPPYFLVLFLFSLTLHAKPCFYCIVLLSTLFISSCYWQPFPLDTQLSAPWADSITTFAEALTSALPSNYSQPLPAMIRPVDRCWCDLSSGGLFRPFNVSNWEYQSVMRLKEELVGKDLIQPNSTTTAKGSEMQPSSRSSSKSLPFWLRSVNLPPFKRIWAQQASRSSPAAASTASEAASESVENPLSFLLDEYDLRPYGLDLIIDFSWSQSS